LGLLTSSYYLYKRLINPSNEANDENLTNNSNDNLIKSIDDLSSEVNDDASTITQGSSKLYSEHKLLGEHTTV
jgi:hypothetical protein